MIYVNLGSPPPDFTTLEFSCNDKYCTGLNPQVKDIYIKVQELVNSLADAISLNPYSYPRSIVDGKLYVGGRTINLIYAIFSDARATGAAPKDLLESIYNPSGYGLLWDIAQSPIYFWVKFQNTLDVLKPYIPPFPTFPEPEPATAFFVAPSASVSIPPAVTVPGGVIEPSVIPPAPMGGGKCDKWKQDQDFMVNAGIAFSPTSCDPLTGEITPAGMSPRTTQATTEAPVASTNVWPYVLGAAALATIGVVVYRRMK